MHECKIAYRFLTGKQEVEGFKGIGFNKSRARQDAINQIGRKLMIIREGGAQPDRAKEEFDPSRVIEKLNGLTPAELEQVQKDWDTNVRY